MRHHFCARALVFFLPMIGCSERPASLHVNHETELIVSASVLQTNVHRAGLNLGGPSSWGAEQLLSNVLFNPGFEGTVDGALATVQSSNGASIEIGRDDTYRGVGAWNGGRLTVQSGQSAGASAAVVSFEKDAVSHKETVVLESPIGVASGDIVSLSKVNDAGEPSHWWISANRPDCHAGPARPGSPGARSWTLCSNGSKAAEMNSFLDTITQRAGKLLPIEGKWRLSFWSLSSEGHPRLSVSFSRVGSRSFFVREFSPSPGWQKTIVDFDARDDGPNGPLQLHFTVNDGALRLDDMELVRASDETFPFRKEVIETLKSLRPGYLRDWEGQLGDTVDNRLAAPFARRTSRYRSDSDNDAKYEYSLPEFLDLCHTVGADPWIVLPTINSDNALEQLGNYLRSAQQQLGFGEILVEFGNEDWNPLFAAAGIQDPSRYSEASSRAFADIRKGFGSSPSLRTVVNAQFANTGQVQKVAASSTADIVAVAPYFAFNLPLSAAPQQTDTLLFTSQREPFLQLSSIVAAHKHELSFYEMNLHTVGGDALPEERDRFVLSTAAGAAVADRMIDGFLSGVGAQCLYSLAGYDSSTNQGKSLVQLWGIARDLSSPNHFRSTGLALELFNQAVQKESHAVLALDNTLPEGITAIAFHGTAGWSVAIVSSRQESSTLSLRFPPGSDRDLPRFVATLSQLDPNQGQEMKIRTAALERSAVANKTVRVQVPARDMVILLNTSVSGVSQ
jgi:hypothetical protein